MVKIATQCINFYYTVLQYCDIKLNYEGNSVTHAARLCCEYVSVYGCQWGFVRVYGGLWESTDKYEYTSIYGCLWELCMSMGVYWVLWESMDKYEYSSVYGCLWEFVYVYRVCGSMGRIWGEYGSLLWINMSMWVSIGVYECFWVSMGVYGNLWININIRVFMNIDGSLCMSSLWDLWEYMGGFWKSMEEYVYAGINTIEILWLTPYDSWCTTFDFFVALSAPPLYRGGKPELKFFVPPMKQIPLMWYASYRQLASRDYIFSPDFVQIATLLASNASARHCLFWIICHRRFHYSLSFALFCRRVLARRK